MRTLARAVFGASLVLSLCATAGAARAQAGAASTESTVGSRGLVREARAFMEAYARDLLAGERQRIVERYDPRGAYFVGGGRKELLPTDSIRAVYFGGWRPPASFEWQDLSYEVAGPDAVVVAGRFVWGTGTGRRLAFSYTSLLLRRDGRLRIRLEDESAAAAPDPAP